jgi:hypothetical protein
MLLGRIALGFAGTAVAGIGLLCSEGMIVVNVVERQPETHHIYVIAPAMLAPIGMHFVPRQDLMQASDQIRPYLPAIRAALEEFRRADDFILVEVKKPGQRVRVAKDGGSVVVDVEEEGSTVHVSTPIRAISSTIEELAAGNRST